MRKRLLLLGVLLLVMLPLTVPAADPVIKEEPALTPAAVKEMLAGREGDADTIAAIQADRVFFAGDSSFRLTDKTQYYAANGAKLTRLNFQKGAEVKYFLDSPGSVGLMIKTR